MGCVKPLLFVLTLCALGVLVAIVWQIVLVSTRSHSADRHGTKWIIATDADGYDEHLIKVNRDHYAVRSQRLKRQFGWLSVSVNKDVALVVEYLSNSRLDSQHLPDDNNKNRNGNNDSLILTRKLMSELSDKQLRSVEQVRRQLEHNIRPYLNQHNNWAKTVHLLGATLKNRTNGNSNNNNVDKKNLRFVIVSNTDAISWGFHYAIELMCNTFDLLVYDTKQWILNQVSTPYNWRRVFVHDNLLAVQFVSGWLVQAPLEVMPADDSAFLKPMLDEAKHAIEDDPDDN
ncbi:hypothetical protein GZH46_01852 [Fragariocoptes setiger]|uniref:Uncharacterized protein n=1 Tax=Fragariocoptes setiger TaxID=1670756 RepID=A0ABQ7S854_9ACAR|nr:hypothetical protein GZH46_01852 [Fragariocoptes setiger]